MKYLIIDDEIYARKALAKRIQGIMSDYDVEIYEAENVPTAKIILQKLHFDIIFLDIYMPGENGLELAEYLGKSNLTYEIVVVSGYAEFEYAQKALELGIRHYLLKPANEDKLREILKESWLRSRTEQGSRMAVPAENICQIVFGEGTLELPFKSQEYIVMAIRANRDLDDRTCMQITGFLFQICRENMGYTINPMRLSELVAVCGAEKVTVEKIKEKLEPLLELCDIYIGVSNPYLKQGETAKAYHEAVDALNNRLIDRWNKIFLYSEERILPLNESEFQMFSQALVKQEYELACAILNRIFNSSIDDKCHFSQIQYIYQKIVNSIREYQFTYRKESEAVLIQSINSFRSMKEILNYFQELLSTIVGSVPKENTDTMRDVVDYIHQYYYDFISLEALARERYYMNPKYFGKLFRDYTGMSFSKYLTKVRMEKAAEYLEDGNYSIHQISYMCGYTNTSHFIQTFKKYYNETPAKWKGGKK